MNRANTEQKKGLRTLLANRERRAAEEQFNKGMCYYNGDGAEQDKKEAVQWFRKAAEQGFAEAQFYLGVCYKRGEGVEQDMEKAVKWYRKAAEQGNAEAQNNLGFCYDNGEGVEQNKLEAVKWYRKAAEQGEPRAQYNLGVCYDNGEGVAQDKVEAVEWYRKAAAGGEKNAEKALERLSTAGEESQGTKRQELRRLPESETNVSESVVEPPLPSSHSVVREQLAMSGVQLGWDPEKKRIVVVETQSLSLKGDKQNGAFRLKESYDFRDDADDDIETKRFKVVWKAYADGVASIAKFLCANAEIGRTAGDNMPGHVSTRMSVQQALDGVVTVTMAESFNNETYEVSVAVGKSEKKRAAYSGYKSGKKTVSPGRHSLKEWIDARSSSGIICPQSFVDKDGVWWRVAGVPVAAERHRKIHIEKAKWLAASAAIRTISIEVKAIEKYNIWGGDKDDGSDAVDMLDREVKIKPLCEVSLFDPTRVQWFDIESESPITGKVRVIVCAIREDPGTKLENHSSEKGSP